MGIRGKEYLMLVNYRLADGKVIQVEVNEEVAKFLEEDKKRLWREKKQDKANTSISSIEEREEQGEQIADENTPSPEELLIAEEDELEEAIKSEKLKEAIEQLNPRQQEVLKLYYYDGLSYQQIASRIGVSKQAIGCAMKIIIRDLKLFLKK